MDEQTRNELNSIKKMLLEILQSQLDLQMTLNEQAALQAAMTLVLNRHLPGFDRELQQIHSGAEALLNAEDEPAIRQLKQLIEKLQADLP